MRARILLLASALSGCYLIELRQLKAPALQTQQVEVRDFSLTGVDLLATVEVRNPNGYAIALLPSTASVKVNGAKVLDTTLPTNLDLPANGRAITHIGVHIPWSSVQELSSLLSQQIDETSCDVEALAHFKTPVGELEIPLEFHTRVPLPRVPKLSFQGLRVTHVSFTDANVEVQLSVDNPNGQPLTMDGLDARLLSGERVLADVKASNNPVLRPGSTQLSLAVSISFLAAGPAILDSLQSHGSDLRLVGTVQIGGQSIPIDKAINAP